MSALDWFVLGGTLFFIVAYGIWKSRGSQDVESYLMGKGQMPWYTIGLSIMATQASAITFLSAPGQAYYDGMRFVQFYFGLPIAMVILSITVLPIYHRLKVFTAYEFLEKRFDLKTRSLGALLFLMQRGLAAGLTIYAPAIILSSILGWSIVWTNLLIGGLVIIYTVVGGTTAVSQTQKQQMIVILVGMVIAGFMVVMLMPEQIGFTDALGIAGKMGRLNVIDLEWDWTEKYNIWSGLLAGTFLFLSYFGTDQSQVQRYLTGRSVVQSRLGLLFNGMLKIPMQFLILLIGAMLFVFYLFEPSPIFFNKVEVQKLEQSAYSGQLDEKREQHLEISGRKRTQALSLAEALRTDDEARITEAQTELQQTHAEDVALSKDVAALMRENDELADTNDINYIFLTFVTEYLPAGLVGLLIAVILSASMSSTSSELNALASTTVVDIYRRSIKKKETERHYMQSSKWFTLLWGLYAISLAMFASELGSLIEAVNVLGSLFYGTILGIFMVAFYTKHITGNAVFYAAMFTELVVIGIFKWTDLPFLWLNPIGCLLVFALAWVVQLFISEKNMGKGLERK